MLDANQHRVSISKLQARTLYRPCANVCYDGCNAVGAVRELDSIWTLSLIVSAWPMQAHGLEAMFAKANATLEAIQDTADALADVEAAAAAVERAKGHNDELVSPDVGRTLLCTH